MRKFVIASFLLVPLVLTGCGSQSSEGGQGEAPTPAAGTTATGAAPAPAATAVSGSVKLQTPDTTIQPGAKLQLTLVDVSQQPPETINQQNVDDPTFPQSFRIPFTPGQIRGQDLYVLQADMKANGRDWTTNLQQPVLTHGQPSEVTLTLVPQPTRAEKMVAAFHHAKRQTGNMKVKSGSSSKIGESRSWQVFSDLHGVEFIIEQVNHGDKNFTKTEYAYRNGLPWVVVEEKLSSPKAKPSQTTRVGWGDDGTLVLNQLEKDGQTTTVSDARTKALHKQAEEQYKKFSRKKG